MAARLHAVPQGVVYAVGYVRVSTAREEMISPEIQEQAIRDLCARRGYVLREIIEDLDATGRNFARKGVNKCIAMVEAGEASVVAVWKFSRFGRNRKGWAVNLDRVEEQAGGRLESATEDVDASTAAGKFTRGMFAEIAALDSDLIGESWQEAHDNRRRSGLPHNGGPRFGYIYHRATVTVRDGIKVCPQGCAAGECKTEYRQDPDLVQAVEAMYALYNSPTPYRSIVMALNRDGFRTIQGGLWTLTNLRRFMDSGFAAGLIRVHDNRCPCKTPMTCDRVTFLPGAHEAIISPDVWETYQENRKRRRKLAPRVESPVYPLAGLVRCDRCKGTMTPRGSRARNGEYLKGYIYNCARYANSGPAACKGTRIVRHRVETCVLDWLQELVAADLDESAATKMVRQAQRVVVQSDRERLLREAQTVAKALTTLTVNHSLGKVTDAAYEPAARELETQQTKLQRALDEAAEEDPNHLTEQHVQVAVGLIAEWPTLSVASKRELLGKLIRRIVITSPGGAGNATIDIVPVWDVAA